MSFNMADLLATTATKRGLTAGSNDELEQSKRVKLDSSASADSTHDDCPSSPAHRTSYDHVDITTGPQTPTTTGGEPHHRDDESAKKKPYGGRPLKFQCQHCDRRFHAPSHLKRHVMSHSSERPFRCEVCDKGFLQAWHLGRHMTTHTGNKPFHCAECPRSFGSRFEMKTHINYIHRGIKEHQCNVCAKFFTLRSNLKVHMRKHTGEKPYKCSYCAKRFGQRGHLQYHIRKHAALMDQTCVSHDADSMESDTDKIGCTSPTYVNKSPVTVGLESDKDSGVDSCDSQSITSSCPSPSVKDFDDHSPSYDNADTHVYSMTTTPYNDYAPANWHRGRSIHLKQFVCDLCSSGFESMSSLKAHVIHAHPRKGIAEARYTCAICLDGFDSVEALQTHAQAGHQTLSMPARRTTIMFPAAASKTALAKHGHTEKSLAFSIERLCQSAERQTEAKSPSGCSCCDHPQDDARPRSGLFMPHFAPTSVIRSPYRDDSRLFVRSHESVYRLQDRTRPHSY